MGMRGGYLRKSVEWNNLQFNSIQAFADYQNVTRGGLAYYLKWGKKFRGHEIYFK